LLAQLHTELLQVRDQPRMCLPANCPALQAAFTLVACLRVA
jgi:hypothetical protein